jgi:hypothetical protein
VTDDPDKLRARSDALAAQERETHAKLCRLRAELNSLSTQLDGQLGMTAPRMLADLSFFNLPLGRRRIH